MLQSVDGKLLYIVNLQAIPRLPINSLDDPKLKPYADALTQAIERRIVKEPGQYGIEVYMDESREFKWNIYQILP
jgi:hypothetical protein